MTKEEIIEKVNTFLIDRLEFDAELIKPEAQLQADLGLNSLDIQEIKNFCRHTFGFLPERQDILKLNFLNDIYSLIEEKQNICETI